MSSAYRTCCYIVAWLAACNVFATTPLVTVYKPTVDAYPHYYSLTQAADRQIYIGGENEVLRFDGTRWTRIAAAGPIHSVARDGDRIWVGAFNGFGYVAKKPDSTEAFVDISQAFADKMSNRAIGEIWDILVRPEGIYFRALRDLFLVRRDGKPLAHWHHAGRFGNIQVWNDRVIMQWRGVGLKQLEDRDWVDIPGSAAAADGLIIAMYAIDAGRVLLQYNDSHFSLLTPKGMAPYIPLRESRDYQGRFRPGQLLADGTLLLPGADGNIGVLEVSTRRMRSLELGSNYLSALMFDSDGAIWALGLHQITRINWPSVWTQYVERDGVVGGIYRFKRVGDWLYVMTVDGMLRAPANISDPRFTRVDWRRDSTWDIVEDRGGLLVAAQFDLFSVRNGALQTIGPNDLYPRMLVPSRHRDDRIWVATAWGIALLERAGNSWQVGSHMNKLQTEVLDLVESPDNPRELWLATHSKGLLKLSMSADGRKIENVDPVDATPSPEQSERRLSRIGHHLIASAGGALAAWNGKKFDPDALPRNLTGLVKLLSADETVSLRQAPDGTLWALSYRAVYRQPAGRAWQKEEVSSFAQGPFVDFSLGARGEALVASTAAIFRSPANAQTSTASSPNLRLQQVRVIRPGHDPEPLPPGTPARIAPGQLNLQFDLSLSDFTRAARPKFQARLAGFDEDWSPWSEDAQFTYPRLPPGHYFFEARALDTQGRRHEIAEFELTIDAHWYQTRTAWAIFAVIAFGLLGIAVLIVARWRTRRLDGLVKTRTLALEDANQQLQNLASRDGLTGVFNRRKFDQLLHTALNDAVERAHPVALLLIDVDHFKEYNDQHGHLAGDEVLKAVGRLLAAHNDAAQNDTGRGYAARYGGEEFVVLLCGVAAEAALATAETIRQQVKDLSLKVSVSIGVAATDPLKRESAVELIARADGALYLAKNSGRDRCVLAR